MLHSLWTRGCSVLLIGVSLLGNGLPWQRAADDPYAFMPEPENTVQIACVGNSDLYSGFVPPVLWGNQGYSATVYASARQSLTKSYALLERVFATQSPALVVLETDMLYDQNPQEREMPRVLARQTRAKHLGQDVRNLASVFRQTGAQARRFSLYSPHPRLPLQHQGYPAGNAGLYGRHRGTGTNKCGKPKNSGSDFAALPGKRRTAVAGGAALRNFLECSPPSRCGGICSRPGVGISGFEPAVRSNGIGRRRRFSGRRQSPECNRRYRRYRLPGAIYCPPVPSAGSARQFPLCQPSRGMGMLPPVCKRKCIKQRSDGGMEPYNRFLPKKAGAVPCDRWYLALQTNVGVDPVVVRHIAAVQVV